MKPENANETCVGPASETAGKADSCAGCPSQAQCASGEVKKDLAKQSVRDEKISKAFATIERTILVLSGKGGVGKSTCSAQLAFSLAHRGYRVGLLDVDICGPSVPLMLGLSGHEVHQSASGWSPVYVTLDDAQATDPDATGELAVMSIGFLVPNQDSAIIWRGPKKNGLIEQFFTTVDWGDLDYLIIDTPPGTSDEHISLVQMLRSHLNPAKGDGAIVVSTPQEVAMMDVRKELNFCKTTKLNVLGVVENMASSSVPLSALLFRDSESQETVDAERVLQLVTDKCPELLGYEVVIDMFPKSNGGVEQMATTFGVPFLGRIPLDKAIQKAGESGRAVTSSEALKHWKVIVDKIDTGKKPATQRDEETEMEGVIVA